MRFALVGKSSAGCGGGMGVKRQWEWLDPAAMAHAGSSPLLWEGMLSVA